MNQRPLSTSVLVPPRQSLSSPIQQITSRCAAAIALEQASKHQDAYENYSATLELIGSVLKGPQTVPLNATDHQKLHSIARNCIDRCSDLVNKLPKQAPLSTKSNLSSTTPVMSSVQQAPNPSEEISQALKSDHTGDLLDASSEDLKAKMQSIDRENELLVQEINEVQLSLKPASNKHSLVIKKYEENKSLKNNLLNKLKSIQQLEVEKTMLDAKRSSKRLSMHSLTESISKTFTPTKGDKYYSFIQKNSKYLDSKNPTLVAMDTKWASESKQNLGNSNYFYKHIYMICNEKQHPFYELLRDFSNYLTKEHAIHEAAWVSAGAAVQEAKEFTEHFYDYMCGLWQNSAVKTELAKKAITRAILKTIGEFTYDHMIKMFSLSFDNKRREKYLIDMAESTLEELTTNEVLLLPVRIIKYIFFLLQNEEKPYEQPIYTLNSLNEGLPLDHQLTIISSCIKQICSCIGSYWQGQTVEMSDSDLYPVILYTIIKANVPTFAAIVSVLDEFEDVKQYDSDTQNALSQFKATLDWAVPSGSDSNASAYNAVNTSVDVQNRQSQQYTLPVIIPESNEVQELKLKVKHLEEQLRILEAECVEKEQELKQMKCASTNSKVDTVTTPISDVGSDISLLPPPIPDDILKNIDIVVTPSEADDILGLNPPIISDNPIVHDEVPKIEANIVSPIYESSPIQDTISGLEITEVPSLQESELPFRLIYSESVKAIYNAASNVLEDYQLFCTISIEKLAEPYANLPSSVYSFHVHLQTECSIVNSKVAPLYAKIIENPDASHGSFILKCKVSHDTLRKGDVLLCKFELANHTKSVPLRLNAKYKLGAQNVDILMQYALNPLVFSDVEGLRNLSILLQPLVSNGNITEVEVQPPSQQTNVHFSPENQYCEWSIKEAFVVPPTSNDTKLMLRLKSPSVLQPSTTPSPIRVSFNHNGNNFVPKKNLGLLSIEGVQEKPSALYKEKFVGCKYNLQNAIYEYHF